jgi:hypothetical protein
MKMNESDHRKFWGWPGAKNLAYAYFVLGIPSFAWFAFVYAGADYWTARHQYRVPLYHSAELLIPLIPATTVFYNSLHLIYAVAPFILRTRSEMNALAIVWYLMTLVGGIFFLIIPFEPGFPRRIPPAWGYGEGCMRLPTTPISDSIAVRRCMSPGELRRSTFMPAPPLEAARLFCGVGRPV